MLRNVNRIIFDLDNTLLKHDVEKEIEEICKNLPEEYHEKFKHQILVFFRNHSRCLKKTKVTEENFVQVVNHLMPVLKECNLSGKDLLEIMDSKTTGRLMEGAKETLEYLRDNGYQIVLLTNWFYKYQVSILKKLGIFDYFERIYAWDDYYAKPHMYSYIRALENTNPRNNVIIGDDPIGDVAAPKKYGIRAIGFNIDYYKFHKNAKIVRADINISQLYELKKYL